MNIYSLRFLFSLILHSNSKKGKHTDRTDEIVWIFPLFMLELKKDWPEKKNSKV